MLIQMIRLRFILFYSYQVGLLRTLSLTKMANLFSNKLQAAVYAKFRTPCPESVLKETIDYVKLKCIPPLKLALDVGCGTGLSSRILAPYFENVLGTDLSDAQLERAFNDPRNPPNVKFQKSPAEVIPLEDKSVQLVTVCNALHWFNHAPFFAEVKRVLVPNGVLMVWRDRLSKIIVADPKHSEELSTLFTDTYFEVTRPYTDPRLQMASDGYTSVDFPFQDVIRIKHTHDLRMKMSDLIGLCHSLSPVQKMKEADPELSKKILENMEKRPLELLGSLDSEIVTEMEGYLILCRHN